MPKILPNSKPFGNFRVYGPYFHREEGRRYVFIYAGDKNKTSMSFARYLLCVKEGRYLTKDEQADHIDGDRANDSLLNLRILSPSENKKLARKKMAMVTLTCLTCKSAFERKKCQMHGFTGNAYCTQKCFGVSRRKKR